MPGDIGRDERNRLAFFSSGSSSAFMVSLKDEAAEYIGRQPGEPPARQRCPRFRPIFQSVDPLLARQISDIAW